ncbi:MAG: protein kinase [Vicinamibacteria bacterium]
MSSETGRRVAHYEIGAKLGSGGMGDVYAARDTRLDREVAIKFLPASVAADRTRLARFEQEAKATSALNHPNIVTVHEIGTADGVPYIVMELVRGHTLRELMEPERPLPTRKVLDWAVQIADGMAKAHAAGIVHRDLKPENVMVTHDDGLVKILDFGLAKLLPDFAGTSRSLSPADPESPTETDLRLPSPETHSGAILGTAGYMSPEQARSVGVDYRADQFSLGSILYEMLTGRRAFRRETPVQTLAAIIETEPEPIAAQNPSVPPPVRWIVERCLEKAPSERYASTLDLARDLRQLRERLEETRTPSGGVELEPVGAARGTWTRARLALAGLGALALAGFVLRGPIERLIPPPLPSQRQLAVLPFADLSREASTRAFGEGLVDTLTTGLKQLERFEGSLSVVPAADVRAAQVESAAAARRLLGANLVITGSVQLSGEALELAANLVDTATGRPLRSMRVEGRLAELRALQEGIVRRAAQMLDVELGADAERVLAAGGTTVASAWEIYVQGRGHLQRYESEESLGLAISAFQSAIQKDPGYALAYAGLAEAHALRYRLTRDPQSVELAGKACARALALNDLLAPVHVTLGLLHTATGQPEQAVQDLQRALALDPVSGDALRALGKAQEALGRLDEAEKTYRRAAARAPRFWGNWNALGTLLFRRGRYDEAEQAFRRVIALAPDNERGYRNLGGVLQSAGRVEEALRVLERSLALRPTYAAAANLATLRFDRGDYAGAARAFEQALALDDRDYRVWRFLGAARQWVPAEREQAAAAYRRAAELAERQLAVNPRDAEALVALAECRAQLGEGARARPLLAKALALAPGDVEVMQAAGSVYEVLGERALALRWVNRALEGGYSVGMIERDPGLAALRADPLFRRPDSAGAGPKAGETANERRR